jgi:hypothetical protein
MGRERQTERERERRERERKMTKFRKNIEPCAAIFKWKTTKSNSRRRDAPCIMLASMTPKLIFSMCLLASFLFYFLQKNNCGQPNN